jgi:hypothetical protein
VFRAKSAALVLAEGRADASAIRHVCRFALERSVSVTILFVRPRISGWSVCELSENVEELINELEAAEVSAAYETIDSLGMESKYTLSPIYSLGRKAHLQSLFADCDVIFVSSASARDRRRIDRFAHQTGREARFLGGRQKSI